MYFTYVYVCGKTSLNAEFVIEQIPQFFNNKKHIFASIVDYSM